MNAILPAEAAVITIKRSEMETMVRCAWSLRSQAARHRSQARQAEAADNLDAYRWHSAKAQQAFRKARSFVRWAAQRRDEITQMEEMFNAA